jgi:L-ascorbate metabolism protein UlaG (beta-lactamase superfamily)
LLNQLLIAGMALFPVFGKAAAGVRLERIRRSLNFKRDRFENEVPTEVTLKGASLFKMLREYRNRPASTVPEHRIPSMRTDLRTLPDDKVSMVWFGHSSYLLKVKGTTILVDPVFSANASPVSFMAKAFPGTEVYTAADMPKIDILLLTHDHYDHLDYPTILELIPKTKQYCTSLGVGAHLESWGVAPEKIVELDWWEGWSVKADGIAAVAATNEGIAGEVAEGRIAGTAAAEGDVFTFTATPARHFSGRSFKRGGTLWSSFVLKTAGYSLFLGGDSGYEQHFKAIGDRFGPFDLAVLECGQYGKNWPYIHMTPEQTVQAALDLRAAALLPVHWSKFTLALHPWNEPARRVVAAAAEKALPVATPLIGQPVVVGGPYPDTRWWDFS